MGVIIKQSFWGTFIAYLGVIIGYANALYLRPEFFTLDQIGLFTLITANAMIVSNMSSLGMGSSYIKFFPSFENKHKNQFFTFLLVVTVLGNLSVLFIAYLLKDEITRRYVESSPQYIDFLSITAIVIFANSLFDLLFSYSRTILKVIFPSFLRDIFLRFGAIILVLGYALDWYEFEWAVRGLGINYILAFLLLFTQLIISEGLRLDFRFAYISKEWRKKLFLFAGYSMLLASSFALLNNVTYDQITTSLGPAANGIFTTCFFIAVIVEMPRRNMAKVINPVISSAFENNDMKLIESIYKRSSITMTTIGSLIFIGIITNISDLFSFIPKGSDFEMGYWVVIGVCLAKLLTMLSSFPGEIINFSPYYRYNLIFQVVTAILLVSLNYFLIEQWGLNGAAISYLIAIVLHAIVKMAYVKMRFKIHPFMPKHTVLIMIAISTGVLFSVISFPFHPIINIILRSVATSLIFVFLIYRFKVSPDINNLINSTFERVFKIKLSR